MKVALVERLPGEGNDVGKDQMGGYGINTQIGDSLLAKILTATKKKRRRIPFLLLGYLTSILQKNGHEVFIVSGNEPPDVDLIIIPTSIVECSYEVEFAKRMKNERKKTKVGLIGPFAAAQPDYYKDGYDFIISGEPEGIFMSITDLYIPEGYVKSEPIENLDSLPFPDWNLFPVDKYSYKPILLKNPMLPVLSSRGCAYKCDYCAYPVFYNPFRKRSSENVINEIKYLKDKYGIRSIIFRDPLFTCDIKRSKQLAKDIISNNLNSSLEWACETRLDMLNEEVIDLFYESGLRGLNVGIESINTDVLKKADRIPINIEHQTKIINYCHKKGIRVAAFYVFGLEGDTKESINSTIEYAKKLNTIVAQFTINTLLPGTPLYEKVKHKIYEKDWENFTFFNPVLEHDNFTKEELLQLKEYAWVSYYFDLRYLKKYFWKIVF